MRSRKASVDNMCTFDHEHLDCQERMVKLEEELGASKLVYQIFNVNGIGFIEPPYITHTEFPDRKARCPERNERTT